jgi:polyhydroxybutyrate depolymerase
VTRFRRLIGVAALLTLAACGERAPVDTPAPSAAPSPVAPFTPGRHVASFEVGGVVRTAVLVVPAGSTRPAPAVFVFHGHGGSGAGIQRTMRVERLWLEAVVVYPDGLPGHQGVTDPQGVKPGWQTVPGESGDRDLAFYDTVLAALRLNLSVDPDRLYVMGHSNGSAFTTLLLNRRGDAIAATANSSAAPSPALLAAAPVRSMFISMGTQDRVVPYERQRQSLPAVEAKLAHPDRAGVELVTYVHPGGHDIPDELPAMIVDFFRRHTLSGG